jgi:hypothetical protein
MMNWNGCGRRRSWPNLRYYPSICLEGPKKTTRNLSGEPVSGPRFQPGTSRIQIRSFNHSTKKSGVSEVWLCMINLDWNGKKRSRPDVRWYAAIRLENVTSYGNQFLYLTWSFTCVDKSSATYISHLPTSAQIIERTLYIAVVSFLRLIWCIHVILLFLQMT